MITTVVICGMVFRKPRRMREFIDPVWIRKKMN